MSPHRRTTCCRPADVDSLLKRHDHNIVAIDVPLDRDGPDRYELAGAPPGRMDRCGRDDA